MSFDWFLEVTIETLTDETLDEIEDLSNGINNEGTTWYANSQIQWLFAIAPIRNSVMNYPNPEFYSELYCLQDLFYKMQFEK